MVGLVSSALGLLAGVGLAVGIRELLAAVGIEVPTTSAAVEPRTVVAALLVGVVVTVVAAVVPALGATRVAPVEALREADAHVAAASAGSAGVGGLGAARRSAWPGWSRCAVAGTQPVADRR